MILSKYTQYSIDVLVDTQLTVSWYLGGTSVESQLIKCQLTLSCISTNTDQASIKMLIKCWLRHWSSVDERSIEGIDWHSTADAFSTHDPDILGLFCHKVLRECSPYPLVDTFGTRIVSLLNPRITYRGTPPYGHLTFLRPDFCGPLVTGLTGFHCSPKSVDHS